MCNHHLTVHIRKAASDCFLKCILRYKDVGVMPSVMVSIICFPNLSPMLEYGFKS